MGFNLGKELNKLKEFAIDAAPYVTMAAPFIPGVNPGVMSLMEKYAPWMKTAMQSKFMNSVMGASLKDAGLSYAMAKMQGKRNPHLIAKNALLRNMFVNANKVGWDMDMMMGGDKLGLNNPNLQKYAEDVASDYNTFDPPLAEAPFDLSKNVMPHVSYKTGTPYMVGEMAEGTRDWTGDYNVPALSMLDQADKAAKRFEEASLAKQLLAKEALAGGAAGARQSLPFEYIEGEKNPLAGMGFLTTTKTKPSWMDKFLKRSEEAKDLGITAGTDAYDEFYGIGETRPDVAKMLGLGYDFFVDPRTDPQIERDEQEEFERKMAKLMWPRSMADVYGFESKFLGKNRGGLASLANGGRIGYQGGGIGPAGMRLEETPMAARKDVTIKSQLEDLYKLYMEKGLLTPGLAKMLGWDDPNEYYNNELWQRDFGDPLNANVGPGGNILTGYDEMAYDPEGAGPMTPVYPMDFDDDFIFDEGTIGPNPTFEDEFGDYLDLASGPDNQGIHDAYEDYLMNGGTLDFEDWKISVQEVMNPEDWAASRGGKTPKMYGGGDLNAIPGGMVSGPGTETSDSIPAQLSNNEFVVTADAVRAAGGGDIDLGAQKFYGIMNALDPNSAKLGEPPVYS